MSDWTCDANEALTLSLGTLAKCDNYVAHFSSKHQVRAQKDREALSREESFEGFNPMFTYPASLSVACMSIRLIVILQIFGENEKIYGYKDLLIDVRKMRKPFFFFFLLHATRHSTPAPSFVSPISCGSHLDLCNSISLFHMRKSCLRHQQLTTSRASCKSLYHQATPQTKNPS